MFVLVLVLVLVIVIVLVLARKQVMDEVDEMDEVDDMDLKDQLQGPIFVHPFRASRSALRAYVAGSISTIRASFLRSERA